MAKGLADPILVQFCAGGVRPMDLGGMSVGRQTMHW